jgi:dUTP pyrophosphatase
MTSPPRSPTTRHQAPSLPNSPLPKRPKSDHSSVTTMTSAAMPEAVPTPSVTTDISAAPPLLIKKLSPKARTPTRGSAFAAGYDLYSAHDITIPAKGKAMVDTDLAIAVPLGTCKFQIW